MVRAANVSMATLNRILIDINQQLYLLQYKMINIYTQLANFISKHQRHLMTPNSSITSQRVSRLLFSIISQSFEQASSLDNQYFKDILYQVSQTIINVVYRKQQIYVKVDHLVSYISTIQFIVHNKAVQLPSIIGNKLQKYVQSIIVLQDLLKIKSIFLDSLNSTILSNFYKNIFVNAFQHRYKSLIKKFGIQQKGGFLALQILIDLIQKNEFNLQFYESYVTSEWIILSMIYYVLAAKYRPMRQIPVLSNILKRYFSTNGYQAASRTINGNQLCHFYNNIFLAKINGIQAYQVDKMIDETVVESQAIANLIVTPIQSEDNTVLDNIAFSSSYEH